MLGEGDRAQIRHLRGVLAAGENERVSFHLQVSTWAALMPDVIAFANGNGGTIVLGVAHDGRAAGIDLDDREVSGLLAFVQSHSDPSIQVTAERVTLRGHEVVVLQVPEASRKPAVVTDNAVAYLRMGDTTRRASVDDLHRLVHEAHPGGFEDAPIGATFEDLDVGYVKQYVARRGEQSDALNVDELEARLVSLGYFAIDAPREARPSATVACLLLFGRRPQDKLPQARVDLVLFPGRSTAPDAERESFGGTVLQQLDDAIAALRRHLLERDASHPRVATRVDASVRMAREVLLNALTHRDYGLRYRCVELRVFSDAWEVITPGRVIGPFVAGGIDKLPRHLVRNPRLAEALRVLGYGQEQANLLTADFASELSRESLLRAW